jgi:hypothetical protein
MKSIIAAAFVVMLGVAAANAAPVAGAAESSPQDATASWVNG